MSASGHHLPLAGYDAERLLPFDFATKTAVTTETTFTGTEIEALHDWVTTGGSLLVFSEHAPFDQAINPVLYRFGMSSSVGTVVDTEHYDKTLGRPGWIVFSRGNGYLNEGHPITKGRDKSEAIDSVVTLIFTCSGFIFVSRLCLPARLV